MFYIRRRWKVTFETEAANEDELDEMMSLITLMHSVYDTEYENLGTEAVFIPEIKLKGLE